MRTSFMSDEPLQTLESKDLPAGIYLLRIKDEYQAILLNELIPIQH